MDTKLFHIEDRVQVFVEKSINMVDLVDQKLPPLSKNQVIELPEWIAEVLESMGVVRIVQKENIIQEFTLKSNAQETEQTLVKVKDSLYHELKKIGFDSSKLQGFIKTRLRIVMRHLLGKTEIPDDALTIEERIVISRLREFIDRITAFLTQFESSWQW
ncbi:MAG: hypothetical protein QXL15_02010 [Candidatus Korarchaeota archaeon]